MATATVIPSASFSEAELEVLAVNSPLRDENDVANARRTAALCIINGKPRITGRYLTVLRTLLGMTQPQFGEMLGYAIRAVIRWETGEIETPAAIDRLIRIEVARVLMADVPPFPKATRSGYATTFWHQPTTWPDDYRDYGAEVVTKRKPIRLSRGDGLWGWVAK